MYLKRKSLEIIEWTDIEYLYNLYYPTVV